ncbi:MAG TPA: chemotaxis-specific protein-glutamate methyltransferase CheB [Bacteroidales bacterium]|nr:chemotaxis-specific protein-glutamate methyltransferase CheB [Bacteroidales bacterium]
MDKLIKVLIVDDSAYIRKVLKMILNKSPFIEVVGTATNGIDALEKAEQLEPDVITCDLIMPEMDGVSFIREQMKRKPVPIVVVSIASESGEMALKALEACAVSFVQKPTALATDRVFEMSEELVQAVKNASGISLRALINQASVKPVEPDINVEKRSGTEIIVIGISTGGPQGLKSVIPHLPALFPVPVVIVLHMPVGYTDLYSRKLGEISKIHVSEGREGQPVTAGEVIIAPAGKHLTFRRSGDGMTYVHLDSKPFDTPHRPSVDVLFESAANMFGEHVLGVVMTGMGNDGKEGSAWIKAKGGKVICESQETCVVYGMPRSVVEAGLCDMEVPLYDMANKLIEVI